MTKSAALLAFILAGDYPLRHNGATYEPGDIVEMTMDQATAKLEAGRLALVEENEPESKETEPKEPVTEEPEIEDDVIEAINVLHPEDTAAWMKDGRPQVKAIEAVLGKQITAAQRDTAWAVVLESRKPD